MIPRPLSECRVIDAETPTAAELERELCELLASGYQLAGTIPGTPDATVPARIVLVRMTGIDQIPI